MQDIEEIHRLAVEQGSTTYIDPDTGFTVFTELAHRRRGFCCENQCRHCPYDHVNVRGKTKTRKVALVEEEDSTRGNPPPSKGGRHGGRLTSKNVPYTRTGDAGTSTLLTGERRLKTDLSFEAMGTVDELCSAVGVVYAELQPQQDARLDEWLLEIMSRLFDVGSHLAKPRRVIDEDDDDDDKEEEEIFVADGIGGGFRSEHIDTLEDWIDLLTEELPELTSFILPTGTKAAAFCHVARTVCRRAERCVVPLVEARVCDPRALHYLNRLSDFLFAAARYANVKLGTKREEILYRKPNRIAQQRQRVVVSTRSNTTKDEKDNS
ncbi:cob(I)alamin adenosyltransferase [Fistulifera solaris]|uniref:Corrinoid adenosyltransferase MMAB n=1 Tax=Fistulifera solaris TaxID=1519565 RepID=A0A1Z5JU50_FISSO|nr:cob(I)alamin adenosyltransferase [Fistulifera solaris]|eukprot:GAX17565.1 cob(I)alamin adenosyltransferase [Fistulifera solaris]